MTNLNADPGQIEKLLGIVSAKLGVSAESLRKDLEAGKFDAALNNMKPSEAQTFSRLVNDPKALEKFMSAPQAQALYKKLTEGK